MDACSGARARRSVDHEHRGAAHDPGEPTLAAIVDDAVWVTQTDRWDRVFAEDGRPRADVQIASPTILRLPCRAPGR